MNQENEYTKRFDWRTWSRLIGYVGRHRGKVTVMGAVMIFVAGIDVVQPFLTGWLVDKIIIPGELGRLPAFMILFATLGLVQAFNIFLFIALAGKVDMGICYDIRKEGFARLQQLSFSFFDRTSSGWIIARLTSDAQKLGDVIAWSLIDISWGLSYMAMMAVAMVVVNWKLALVSLCVLPPLLAVSLWFQKRILAGYRNVRKENSRITGRFSEGINGARTSKTLVREEANNAEFSQMTHSMREHSVRTATLSSLFMPTVLTLGAVGTAMALWQGGEAVLAGTGLTYGVLVSFVFATAGFFEPVIELSRVFADLQYAQASAERVLSLLDERPQIQDPQNPLDHEHPIQGDIQFNHVDFRYGDGELILKDFNLHVKQGQTIALVGETGSGKSTIVNMACRFYEPSRGQILIDGQDYRQMSQHHLQSHLGYVLQSPQLFGGSVRDNIRYGRLNASNAEVEQAAQTVGAHAFIQKLPEGYDTAVGRGGGKLSVGEKQLISFARAILANPAIFVLDEATSSVDAETEERIRGAIATVLEGRTSFLIAHRLSTVRRAHRILVLEKGVVIEEGTHEQLMARQGSYYSLYSRQFTQEFSALRRGA
ncbi:MAG: ABC transporter ATP-binding protein/permease [Spirochaetales bacterium]|nr:ABC transporter ATP-binding protein/permease [Spirochaetales bacterium]